MTWFEVLSGSLEGSPDEVRAGFELVGDTLSSRANGRSFVFGRLEIPSLAALRERVGGIGLHRGVSTVREVAGDAKALHADPANADALFQVASQFNLLEMTGPDVTPEHGVGRYESDPTQGPACAIACGAGTIYRNYFVPVNGHIGQSAGRQIDCLADLGAALGNERARLWRMRNGYALATDAGLTHIAARLREAGEDERDRLCGLLRIGVQWRPQVTLAQCTHRVSQAYCSALPVAYLSHSPAMWEPFARLVLEAAYEATLWVAAENARAMGRNTVFLTHLGGGAFGNPKDWITDAMSRALNRHRDSGLDVVIVRRAARGS